MSYSTVLDVCFSFGKCGVYWTPLGSAAASLSPCHSNNQPRHSEVLTIIAHRAPHTRTYYVSIECLALLLLVLCRFRWDFAERRASSAFAMIGVFIHSSGAACISCTNSRVPKMTECTCKIASYGMFCWIIKGLLKFWFVNAGLSIYWNHDYSDCQISRKSKINEVSKI